LATIFEVDPLKFGKFLPCGETEWGMPAWDASLYRPLFETKKARQKPRPHSQGSQWCGAPGKRRTRATS
jgi:hypothetical protein